MELVPYLGDTIIEGQIGPVVSSDALGLQVVGRVNVTRVDSFVDNEYRVNVILSDCELHNMGDQDFNRIFPFHFLVL